MFAVYNSKSAKQLKPRKQPGGRRSTGQMSTQQLDFVTKRMLSARRLKINELRNEIQDLQNQLEEMRKENKTLRRQHYIREKALDKFTSQENDVNTLITKHSNEMRVLKGTVRKYKERTQHLERVLKDTEDDLERAKKSLRKWRMLAEDRELGERDDLARKLSKAEALVDEKDQRIRVSCVNGSE